MSTCMCVCMHVSILRIYRCVCVCLFVCKYVAICLSIYLSFIGLCMYAWYVSLRTSRKLYLRDVSINGLHNEFTLKKILRLTKNSFELDSKVVHLEIKGA